VGRLRDIEEIAAGTVNTYTNIKMLVRGRPIYLDPQFAKGTLRFAQARGAKFSALQPANRYDLVETAPIGTTRLVLAGRPEWFQIGCLIRIGITEEVGEAHIIEDLVDTTSLEIAEPLRQTYDVTGDFIPQVSLIGTPGYFFGVALAPYERRILLLESWYRMVPGDVILASPTPEVRNSLTEYTLSRAHLIGTRPGVPGEPPTIYRYECEIGSGGGLLTFTPTDNLAFFLKAHPLFQRSDYGSGDILLPQDLGVCLIDAFYGGLLHNQKTNTILGIKTYDVFGHQTNFEDANHQDWQVVPSNYVLMERNLPSEDFLLWQRIQGHFQLRKTGRIFQAQLDANGECIMSSDVLAPPWRSEKERGWVVPIIAEGDVTMSVQFEPQERQFFDIPHTVRTLVRPKIYADPEEKPITRVVIAFKGAPNSTVQMRTWAYDGSIVNSLSYFILGTGATFGLDRWLAGGFCVKPYFLDLSALEASYSDGVSAYDSGYVYF
jgi:hypothetical protein